MAKNEMFQFREDGPKSLPMGIGTWAWGDNLIWGYNKNDYTDNDLELAYEASIKAGITFLFNSLTSLIISTIFLLAILMSVMI